MPPQVGSISFVKPFRCRTDPAGGRFAALVLFIFNIIAVISYPDLNPAGVQQHQVWGLMLLVLVCYGPGKLSIDHWLRRKYLGAL